MAHMIFAAFDDTATAARALGHLEGADFKSGGFSVIAREPRRAGDGDGALGELLSHMVDAPDLYVDGQAISAAGALVKYLEGRADGSDRGIETALSRLGASPATAHKLEKTVEQDGIVLGVAAENVNRAVDAQAILTKAGALETVDLPVPAEARAPDPTPLA